MLDVSHIPGQTNNIWTFYTQGVDTWQTWIKPRNAKFVWIMCIGGAGGGYGGSNSAGFNGGSGGGSGGVARALFQANVLPDTLFIQPGPGGAGGAGGGIPVTGSRSLVAIAPVVVQMNLVCVSGNVAAGFSTGEAVATTAVAGLLNMSTFNAVAGVNGGANVTPFTNTITCPGCIGGASSVGSTSGASVLATSLSPLISGATTTSVNGGDGIWSWKPMFGLGGAGGCGSTTGAVGSNGGDGAFGCGGGGGGSSSAGGGRGGKGGDGLVIIATF